MKKRSVSLLCIALLLCQLFVSCAPVYGGDDTSGVITSEPDISDTGATVPDTSDATTADEITEGDTSCDTTEELVVDNDPATPGKLVFIEDFENYGNIQDSGAALAALGWVKSEKSDGAYNNNTSKYSIVEHNGSKMLYVENYTSSLSGTDSYVVILSDDQLGYINKSSYTYQYDVEYTTAANSSRYLALVSEYNGAFYNTFHFRNCGTANNQCHFGSWYTYDDASGKYYAARADSSEDTIVYKLLGRKYDSSKQAFSGVSVSIRYVVNRELGNRVYMRVNDRNSYSKGEWVLVSKGEVNSYWDPTIGGAALVLKTGGAQNGYIDNIMVWSGTGDEPDEKTPLLTSKTEGHDFRKIDGADICVFCGRTEEQIKYGWWQLGDKIPVYTDGTPSNALYATGQGMHDKTLSRKNESPMQLFSGTSTAEFEKYLTKLSDSGFARDYYHSDPSGVYASFTKNGSRVYTYYTSATRTVRIIDDRSTETSVADFGYTYQKKAGDTTVLYQYGVPMNEAGVNIKNNDEKKIDCGMMFVMKLADNSVIIFDGGGYQQFDDAQCDGFMNFLETVTGVGKNGKIRIAAWVISHTHTDHFAGLCLFIKKYSARLSLERMLCNLPSVYSSESLFANTKSNYTKLLNYVDTYLGQDFKFMKAHTGEIIDLADVKIRVIYTHEDIVDAKTGTTGIANDFNNSSTVLRIEFDGKSFMFLGDINKPAMNVILTNVPSGYLSADIVQGAHHLINGLDNLYNVICAPVVFVPQSPNGAVLNSTRKNALNALKSHVRNDMLFYASLGTTGVSVVDGEIKVTFTDKVYGGAYVTSWGW